MSISFFSPIHAGTNYNPKESCAFLRGSIHLFNFGQKAYRIQSFDDRSIKAFEVQGEEPSWIGITLRVMAIATVIIPLIMLMGALIYRSLNSFQAVLDTSSRTYRVNAAFQEGQGLLQSINALRRTHLPGWQEKAVKLIRATKKDNLDEEFERLRGAEAVTRLEAPKIESAVNSVILNNYANASKIRKQAKALLGQAHEIKKIYEKTHHVLLHSQSLKWSVVPILIKKLLKLSKPDLNVHNFKFLRTEGSVISDSYWDLISPWKIMQAVSNFLGFTSQSEPPKTAREYITQTRSINDSDMKTRETLLSVDAYFYNAQKYESSLFFLMNNNNILGHDGTTALKNVVKSILGHFKKEASEETLSRLAERVIKCVDFTDNMVTTGNLYVIAVPKEKSTDVQYRAHPFGPACTCHRRGNHTEILEKLQNGILDRSTQCIYQNVPIPQYRLFTPTLKPENGSKIFRMRALTSPQSQSIKTAIANVAQDLLTV